MQQFFGQTKYLLRLLVNRKNSKDDFNWKLYTDYYKGELSSIGKIHSLTIQKGDYEFKHNVLKNKKFVKDLHPNHRLVYETILQLKPSSLLEVGCGGGDHLHNIHILNPKITLFGTDLAKNQLQFLKSRHPKLQVTLRESDITLPNAFTSPRVDIAFTQAVLMHIKTGNGHLVGLANLFSYATKQVILMENWTRHDFMHDIKKLHRLNIIPWKNIFFYYRESPELKKPHLMIISSVKLKNFPVLSDYKILKNNVYK